MSQLTQLAASILVLTAVACSNDTPSGERIPTGLQGLWTGTSIKDGSDAKPVYVTSTTITSRISVFSGTMLFYVRGEGDENSFDFTALKDDKVCAGRLEKGAEGVELNVTCEDDGRESEHAIRLVNRTPF